MKTKTPRESRYVKAARLAYGLARESVPRYAHPKSPHRFTQPQLVACVLLMFYLDLSYRDMEDWLLASDQVCAALELKQIPDHSTLARTFRRLRVVELTRMRDALLRQMGVEEEAVAGDSTSFRLSHASAYYQTRRGQQYREWVKGAYAVGVRTRLIVGWAVGPGSRPDFGFLRPLKRQAAAFGHQRNGRRAWLFLADAGFDAKGVTALDLVPPIRRNGKLVDPKRKARADLVAQARLDGLYGQRWQVEMVNSVLKRKFGDTIRSRSLRLQRREPLVKGLVYNLHL
ncbi:MAG: transposase [Blastochloris sp.]|nr:transposase [Blastochloris sp.]